MTRPILFVSHDLCRAGAQLFLLHFMRWIRTRGDRPFELLVAAPSNAEADSPGYSLRDDAEALTTVHWLDTSGRPTNAEAIRRGAYCLIYANTGTLGPLLASVDLGRTPVLCHVHELGFSLEVVVGRQTLALLAPRVHHWVACTQGVRDVLVKAHGIEPARVDVVPESIPAVALSQRAVDRDAVRAHLSLPSDTFVVVCCGTLDWRKGADLVVALLQALRSAFEGRGFHLVWVGASPTRIEAMRLAYELDRSDLNAHVRLLDVVADPSPVFACGDAFALLSREDPFPLAMLEAAACGLPIVGFAGSGGVSEFVVEGMGFVVPFLDLGAMAAALARLAALPHQRAQMAHRVREQALAFDLDRILPTLVTRVERIADAEGVAPQEDRADACGRALPS